MSRRGNSWIMLDSCVFFRQNGLNQELTLVVLFGYDQSLLFNKNKYTKNVLIFVRKKK